VTDPSILFHPDYTVGPGVSPDLLTLPPAGARGLWPPVGNFAPPRERRDYRAATGWRQAGNRRGRMKVETVPCSLPVTTV